MKNLFLICFFILFFSLFFPFPVSAHRERLDGWITGKLHVDPDDDPIVGKEAALHFYIGEELKRFSPQNCECVVTIVKDDRPLFSQTLTPITIPVSDIEEQFSTHFTFPSPGQYFVQLRGTSKAGNKFDPFFLNFDILVERVEPTATSNPTPEMSSTPIPARIQDVGQKLRVSSLLAALGILAISVLFVFSQKKLLKPRKGKK